MQVKSLGYQTDLIFPAFDGHIIDRGDYLVILTPTNPTFYWGNFLLFAKPPGPGDLEAWQHIFAVEIGRPPQVSHLSFGWDSPEGEMGHIEPFVAAGFEVFRDIVLTATTVKQPSNFNSDVVVKSLVTDEEWQQALQNHIICHGEGHDEAGYRVFATQRMARYRAMTQAGLGHWFGAFLEGQLVGDLGLFTSGPVGRFQEVGTHPDFRRRGVCGSLVYQAASVALEQWGVKKLVMVADENYVAARIYERVGFEPVERQTGAGWWQ